MAEFKASQKAGNTQSLVEFMRERYGSQPAAGDPGNGQPGTHEPVSKADDSTPTVASVDAELKQLKDAKKAAMENFDFEEVSRIEDRQEELREQRETLRVQESTQAQEQTARFNEEAQGYLIKAATLFPQTLQANDPLVEKANEVMQRWATEKDPRATMPAGNLYCYVEAAAELGIQPAPAAPVSSPAPSTPPPVNRAPVTALIASGNATTTQTRAPVDTRSYAERKADYLNNRAPARQVA